MALGKDRGSGKGITDWNCFLKCCRRGGSFAQIWFSDIDPQEMMFYRYSCS